MAGSGRKRSLLVVLGVVASLLAFASPGAAQPTGGAVAGLTALELQVGGVNGVPADAELVALHIAVAGSNGPGFATAWPCDGDVPNASSVNYLPGQVVQSLVLAKLSDAGTVCVFVLETTDVIVDVAGYVPAGSDLRALDTPTRVVDTRDATPLQAGVEFRVPVRGRVGVGNNAGGVGFTITALNGVAPGFLKVYPCDTPLPDTSSLNWLPGQFVPNFVIANLGVNGDVCVWSLNQTDILIDLIAWMPADAEGYELLDSPTRVFDTRDGTGTAARPYGQFEERRVPVDAPKGAVAVIGNLTAADQSGPGLATVFPCGEDVPETASLNWLTPPVAVNSSLGKLGDGDDICLFGLSPTHLVYDVTGFVTSTDFYTPVRPFRLHDTREGWQAECPYFPLANHGGSGSIELLSVETGDTVRTIPTGGFFDSYALTRDCSSLIVPTDESAGGGRFVVRSFPTDGGPQSTFTSAFPVTQEDLDVLDDGRVAVVTGDFINRTSAIRDLVSGDVVYSLDVDPDFLGDTDIALSKDGSMVAWFGPLGAPFGEPRWIEIRRVADRELLHRFDVPTQSFGLDFSHDGRRLLVQWRSEAEQGSSSLTVITRDGLFVDGAFAEQSFTLYGTFLGSGVVMLCRDGILARLDIHQQLVFLRDLGSLNVGAPLAESCRRSFR